MAASEIGVIRTLLSSKPRPQGWAERRARLDDVGSVWPGAGDVELTGVDLGGVLGEWSIVPGSEQGRVLLYFHGGGYCSGSLRSHRRLVSEAGRAAAMRTLAVEYRLAPEHPFPGVRVARLAVDRSDHVGCKSRQQRGGRSAYPQGLSGRAGARFAARGF